MVERRQRRGNILSRMATGAMEWTGSTSAFVSAILLIIVWGATGPLFHYSDTWQLVINTGTNLITFLMVFLIQRSQNKESLAVQLKLDEIVAALDGASNRLISVEDLSEEEMKVLRIHYQRLAEMAKRDEKLTESHSVAFGSHGPDQLRELLQVDVAAGDDGDDGAFA
jgi:low affinity Fe/Cu permease